jgi:hypothetical protein
LGSSEVEEEVSFIQQLLLSWAGDLACPFTYLGEEVRNIKAVSEILVTSRNRISIPSLKGLDTPEG